jgi:hypothetical protein
MDKAEDQAHVSLKCSRPKARLFSILSLALFVNTSVVVKEDFRVHRITQFDCVYASGGV